MTVVQARPHDEGDAAAPVRGSLGFAEGQIPADAHEGPMPVVVYLATDFRSGPPDNGQISLRGTLQAAAWADIAVVRWTPGPGRLDGVAEQVDPRDIRSEGHTVSVDSVRNWPGGVVLIASWPNNEDLVRAAEIVFTGVTGEPRVVRDAGNAQVHLHDRYAGYSSGIDFAARRRK